MVNWISALLITSKDHGVEGIKDVDSLTRIL